MTAVAADRLKSFVERIERLNEEKANLAADVKEVFAEAAQTGFDKKALREVIRLRKKDKRDREELEQLVTLYEKSIGDA